MKYFPTAKVVEVSNTCTIVTILNREDFQEIFFADYKKMEVFSFKRGDFSKKKLSFFAAESLFELDSYCRTIAPKEDWKFKNVHQRH